MTGFGRIVLAKPPERADLNFGTFSLAVLAAAVRDLCEPVVLDLTTRTVAAATGAILAERPELVGITAMGLPSVAAVADLVRSLRREGGEDLAIVAGGHGAGNLPGHLLAAGADAVLPGEAERSFRSLVRLGLGTEGPGLVLPDGEGVRATPPAAPIDPLDDLPRPARDLMPVPGDGIYLLETSRGCPHGCTFCETTRFHGRRWRPRSPARVVDEVRELVVDHDAWIVHFADDNFTADPRRVIAICELMGDGPRPAMCMASARADDLARCPELLPAMAEAGILRVSLGVETLSDALAGSIGKPIPLDTYRGVFERMRQLGMFSVASFIVGLPGETPGQRADLLATALEAAPDSAWFLPFLPLPGTPAAAGRATFDPHATDVAEARRLDVAFAADAAVRARLESAVRAGGIRGTLARGSLAQAARR